ncbi:protein kinase, ATP binding site-containing protein [Tanacetum coccineum]
MMDSNDTKIPMDPGTKLVKAEDGNTVDATYYRSLIGSLRYLLHTRPDLSYSVGLLSRFMQDPKDHHLKAVKQVIRYIKGTKEHGIIYKKEGGCKITGYSDSSYGINTDQGKGTTGIVFYFGESPITWCTQKQPTVALSSCESEFMAATGAACQALWLKRLLSELTGWEEKRITLKVDNVSAIALVRNPVFHGRSKHIDIRYHFIRECVENGHINVEHVRGELQRADILTKALPRLKFVTLRQMLGNQQAVSTIAKRKNHAESLEKFQILLDEIKKATKNFSEETLIRQEDTIVICKGHLSDRFKKNTAAIKIYLPDNDESQFHRVWFRSELEMVSILHHENIVPFIGYCEEICAIVSEYAVNGSLYSQLEDPNNSITWTQRLNICIGVAKGLSYLHSGFGENQRVIHGDFSSKKILLYENLEPKIFGFCNSFLFPEKRKIGHVVLKPVVNEYYKDPVYRQTQIRNKESDVYSYGVVLFEILTGMLPGQRKCIGDKEPLNLVSLVRRYYADQLLNRLLDPRIRDEIDASSLYTFKEIAYKCISFNVKDRPSWNKIIKRLYSQNHGAAFNNTRRFKRLEDSLIPLKDINLAIGVKGPETQIGDGGFGVVYKGHPSERWQNRTVAIKCLRPESYQGEYEFRNELKMIFSFNHENIIPFIGYCDEGNEKIIVYEFASNGSLDCHLKDKDKRRFLTWEHRLKICLGAARGLDYLHSGLGEDNKVIHRDVKSANILLDHNLVAKVCDFGLSKSGLVNQPQAQVYTNVAGTNFYMDPIYHESGILRKESDVYSFGVVMFELLSGMLAHHRRRLGGDKLKPLINIVRRYYDYQPELLIDPLIKDKIDSRSFDTYSKVALQCISFNSKERPTMEMIVDRIEEALEFQVSKQSESQAKGDAELNHPGSLE